MHHDQRDPNAHDLPADPNATTRGSETPAGETSWDPNADGGERRATNRTTFDDDTTVGAPGAADGAGADDDHRRSNVRSDGSREVASDAGRTDIDAARAPVAGDNPPADADRLGDDEQLPTHERADADDRVRGILVQTSADLQGHPEPEILEALQQRFRDTGIDVSDADARRFASEIAAAGPDANDYSRRSLPE